MHQGLQGIGPAQPGAPAAAAPRAARAAIEWPTLALLAACHGAWALGTLGWGVSPPLALAVTTIAVALSSSLQHEAIHGHPTGRTWLDGALVWPAYALLIPYGRFRDTHLAHHREAALTDPYDDPESNYLDPDRWERLPRAAQRLLHANNTLLGRMLLGPAIAQAAFLRGEWRAARAGEARVLRAWAWHLPAMAAVLAWVWLAPMPLPAYLAAAYGGLALVKIRTFLEHQAHERASGRTVIIEDRGPLALLFLNNNLHAVHHMHPRVAWYRLPALYRARRAHYLARNGGYAYRSYAEVLGRHLWRAKDPVPHPLWRGRRARA